MHQLLAAATLAVGIVSGLTAQPVFAIASRAEMNTRTIQCKKDSEIAKGYLSLKGLGVPFAQLKPIKATVKEVVDHYQALRKMVFDNDYSETEVRSIAFTMCMDNYVAQDLKETEQRSTLCVDHGKVAKNFYEMKTASINRNKIKIKKGSEKPFDVYLVSLIAMVYDNNYSETQIESIAFDMCMDFFDKSS